MRQPQQNLNIQTPQLLQTNVDERNRRISNISNNSNISSDSQQSEVTAINDDRKQQPHMPNQHFQQQQQVYSAQQHELIQNGIMTAPVELVPQTQQVIHQNVLPSLVPAQESAPKTKAKEVSSTLPDLAQNLANILSHPKSKLAHPVAQGHETIQSAVIQPVLQSEQYFQPIQPETCMQNIQMVQQQQQPQQQLQQHPQIQQNVQQVMRKLHHLGNSFWVISFYRCFSCECDLNKIMLRG